MAFKVFISHTAHQDDLGIINAVLQRAATLGVMCYMAQHDGQAGTSLDAKLRAQITDSDCVLVFITKQSVNSMWVQWEIGLATALNKLVVPVIQKDVAVPPYLLGREYIPFDPADSSKTADAVSHYLTKLKLAKDRSNAIGWLILTGLGAFALLSKKE